MEMKEIDALIIGLEFLSKTKNHLSNSRFIGIVIFSNIALFPLTYNYEHRHLVAREWPNKLYANELFDYSCNPINNSIIQTHESF